MHWRGQIDVLDLPGLYAYVRAACEADDLERVQAVCTFTSVYTDSLLVCALDCGWEYSERGRSVFKWAASYPYIVRHCLSAACADGDLDKAQYLQRKATKRGWDDADDRIDRFFRTCYRGHVHVASWMLHDILIPWEDSWAGHGRLPERAMFYAAHGGRFNAMQWLMTQSSNDFLAMEEGFRGACVGNHLCVAKWLHAQVPDGVFRVLDLEESFAFTCCNGRFAIARWLMDQDPDRPWLHRYVRLLQTWSAPRDTWMRAVVRAATH